MEHYKGHDKRDICKLRMNFLATKIPETEHVQIIFHFADLSDAKAHLICNPDLQILTLTRRWFAANIAVATITQSAHMAQ